jgi:hypothetical protein
VQVRGLADWPIGNIDAASPVYSAATDRTTGVIADQTIALDGSPTSRDSPVRLRRIRFHDTEKAKTLIPLTNQTGSRP